MFNGSADSLGSAETDQLAALTILLKEQQRFIQYLQRQVSRSNLILQINTDSLNSLDQKEILCSTVQHLGQGLHCDRGRAFIVEPGNPSVLSVCGDYRRSGPTQVGDKLSLAQHPHLQLHLPHFTQSEVRLVTLTAEAPTVVEPPSDRLSGLLMAIYYQGKLSSLIELCRCQKFPSVLGDATEASSGWGSSWASWEWDLLETVGSQLGALLYQAILHEQAQHKAEREALLRLITNQIHETRDLPTILQTVVREVRQLLSTDRVIIYQFFQNWEGAAVREDVGGEWRSILGEISQDNCFTAEYAALYAEGRVRAIPDIWHSGLDPCHATFLQGLQVQANLVVPIVMGETLWGLLIAQECRGPRDWQYWETDLLQQLAKQVAIAIQQAELFQQVQISADRAQAQTRQLQAALDTLQLTQLQLIQTEKLSSLGQMVAGIAHEINNAINFVHANLPFAQDYAQQLLQLLQAYEMAYPETIPALQSLKQETDLDYLQRDFPRLLKSMNQGTTRVRDIVSSLRDFSHLHRTDRKSVDLHKGLESALVLIQHRLRGGAKIHKQFGSVPLVKGHAGQLNQVFFNLLINALDAAGDRAEITIASWQPEPDRVIVSIRDNGPGIHPSLQARIFDPFFTTKEVGQGMGLGLSICYQIVCHNHAGQLRCLSQLGDGAEFQIELPIDSAVDYIST